MAKSNIEWLVRTHKNNILGPFTKEEVKELIAEGKLNHKDEICPSNSFWICLYETEEIKKRLGISPPPKPHGDDEEITQTDQTITEFDLDMEDLPSSSLTSQVTFMANKSHKDPTPVKNNTTLTSSSAQNNHKDSTAPVSQPKHEPYTLKEKLLIGLAVGFILLIYGLWKWLTA